MSRLDPEESDPRFEAGREAAIDEFVDEYNIRDGVAWVDTHDKYLVHLGLRRGPGPGGDNIDSYITMHLDWAGDFFGTEFTRKLKSIPAGDLINFEYGFKIT